ncbi:cytochrome c1 [Actimicrobium sp. CCI2.3]|uniref:cytochrome c1 n=1 Tax=Actimicrobium sp. CCI2.3 TaxID=3048616 RepID=UPI002AB4B029|nr:cytochrome c1 [Actimicrobium sp. CCI2.3]MDY7573389.1 cytochrome c1 [Actimicrobium sp. CCI2.3]MEB0021787.1 cytochrome c1 [Actimicrobium sp. CCI2.3]
MKLFKKLIMVLAFVPALALANEGAAKLDRAPDHATDLTSLQHGAKLFVNYCLNCHAAASMRYNRMRDIGLSEDQIKTNLLFASDKVGDLMKVSMMPKDSKEWFGVVPPDLSVMSRAKSSEAGSGADYLYTYLRTFYKDESRPTGWNNMVYPNAAMPHVLWELQGIREAKYVEVKDPHDESKVMHKFAGYTQVKPGKMTTIEYDQAIGDLVGFMSWMGEPAQNQRRRLGVIVLLFMSLFVVIAWRLNASFWKEVK